MAIWTFYAAFLATFISIIGLSRIAIKEHDKLQPRTLSELAVAQEPLLNHFRKILWICGTLFAFTVYGYLIPRIGQPILLGCAWTLTYLGNLFAAVIPAKDKTIRLHNLCAQAMGAAMLSMAYLFWLNLSRFVELEAIIALTMTLLGILTISDRRRYILYELSFIFLSHISILIAVLALFAS